MNTPRGRTTRRSVRSLVVRRRSVRKRVRHGYTLIELMVSLGSATVLLASLGSAVYLSTQAFQTRGGTQAKVIDAAGTQRDLLSDLEYATGFTERTARAVTFTVPDRTGDGRPDTIRYSWSGVAGDPLLYSLNGSTATAVAQDVRQFDLSYQTTTVVAPVIPDDSQTGLRVLFVSNGTLSGGDTFFAKLLAESATTDATTTEEPRIKFLTSCGYAVQTISASASDSEIAKALEANDVVYISGEVTPSLITSRLTDTAKGVVNEQDQAAVTFGFAQSAQVVSASQIEVRKSDRYITEKNSAGSLTVCSAPQPLLQAGGDPAAGLQILADVRGSTAAAPALLALAAGGVTADGSKAAGRRVQLPWGSNKFQFDALNDSGRGLVARVVEWAAGKGADGDPNAWQKFGYETAYSTGRIWRRVQIATQAVLAKGITLKSVTAYVGGAGNDIRYAVYSDAGGNPGTLLAQSSVGRAGSSVGWVTLTMPDTALPSGTYWLTLSLDNSSESYFTGGTGKTYVVDNRATSNGFLSNWGATTSGNKFTYNVSIHATGVTAE